MKKNIKILSIIIFIFCVTNNKVYAACSYEEQLQQYAQYAQESMKETGIYASLILGQAIQESSFGKSSSTFGTKIGGVKTLYKSQVNENSEEYKSEKALCESKNGQWLSTKEGSNGDIPAWACFGKSGDLANALQNHGKWLLTTYSYRKNMESQTTLEGQLEALKGYAEASNYVCSIINQINSCDLTRFDEGISYNYSGRNIVGKKQSLSNSNCNNLSLPSISKQEIEHYSTPYEGNIEKGWIYNRFKDKEASNYDVPEYKIEQNIDEAIDEIFDRAKVNYNSLSEFSSNQNYSYISGLGGSLPQFIVNNFINPLGAQTCNQSSCYGYYGADTCSSHSGVDLTSVSNAIIYAAFDGTVTSVIRNNKQCTPIFTGSGAKCEAGCSGNIVKITHNVEGQNWVSEYVHMSSIDGSIQNGVRIVKGQRIGIIGTTGCSTGIHLHFQLNGPNGQTYNPEGLLNGKCNLKVSCNNARQVCGG